MAEKDRIYRLEDPAALKALAHPLRGRLLASLRVDGPATASQLGRRLGESSGATSYHLRELARYGLVEDDPEHAGGRERWWRAAHDLTDWSLEPFTDADVETREAARHFLARAGASYARLFATWVQGLDDWAPAWQTAAMSGDRVLRLTAPQLEAMNRELEAVVQRYADAGPDGADDERVVVILQSFPQRGPYM